MLGIREAFGFALSLVLKGGLHAQEIGENKELSFFCIPLIYELLKQ